MTSHRSIHARNPGELCRLERRALAAKSRLARAVLGWSRRDLGFRVGLTQRDIYQLERGETELHRTTVLSLEMIWREHNIEFEDFSEGGFSVRIRPAFIKLPRQSRVVPPRVATVNIRAIH